MSQVDSKNVLTKLLVSLHEKVDSLHEKLSANEFENESIDSNVLNKVNEMLAQHGQTFEDKEVAKYESLHDYLLATFKTEDNIKKTSIPSFLRILAYRINPLPNTLGKRPTKVSIKKMITTNINACKELYIHDVGDLLNNYQKLWEKEKYGVDSYRLVMECLKQAGLILIYDYPTKWYEYAN